MVSEDHAASMQETSWGSESHAHAHVFVWEKRKLTTHARGLCKKEENEPCVCLQKNGSVGWGKVKGRLRVWQVRVIGIWMKTCMVGEGTSWRARGKLAEAAGHSS